MRKTLYRLSVLCGLLLPVATNAMTVANPLYDYTIYPGATLKEVVKVFNETDRAITVTPSVMNFMSKDEISGAPFFYPANERKTDHELAPWIALDKKPVTVAPKQLGNVEFSISVPANAVPGGYFGAILFTENDPNSRTGGIQGGVASLIMLNVNGEASEDMRVTDFHSTSVSYSKLPAEFSVRVENQGAQHQKPVGTITIKNFFGKSIAVIPVNLVRGSVLPDSARIFSALWRQSSRFDLIFGRYTAHLTLNYGSHGQVINADTVVLVGSWTTLLISLLIAAAIIIFLKRAAKWYTARVIARNR